MYTWGPDGLISKRNLSTSTSHWYEFGPQGETRTLRNSSGSSTDTYYYNAYGEQTSSTGSTVNPYRYGGKYGYYSESYTGLVLATQRWYSPQLMRWVSRDPIGYQGGVNLFEYVGSNPVMYIDPYGLDRQDDLRNQIKAVKDFAGGTYDFLENYLKMIYDKRIGNDKYFHCQANCEAASRGPGGVVAAILISECREYTDYIRKGDSDQSIYEDQIANLKGRIGGMSGAGCGPTCNPLYPGAK